MFQKIELRKTRDFSAKINITFEFIRQNFKTLAKAVMFISGPAILAQGLFAGIYRQKILAQGQTESYYGDFLSDPWLEASTIFLFLAYVISLTVVNEFVRLYEIKEDPWTIEAGDIWIGVKKNFFRMSLALIVIFFQTLIGLILLVIPGIYVSVTLSLVPPILIIEKRSVMDSVRRSYSLITTTEKWWSTFGLLMVTFVIIIFMSVVFSLPQAVFVFIVALHKTSTDLAEPVLWQQAGIVAGSVISTLGSNLLQSIIFLALIFQFYNLVERKEAQGLMNRLESFGKTDVNSSRNDETY